MIRGKTMAGVQEPLVLIGAKVFREDTNYGWGHISDEVYAKCFVRTRSTAGGQFKMVCSDFFLPLFTIKFP